MNADELRTLLEKYADEYNKGNWEFLYPFVAENFIFHNFPFPDVVGIEANREYDRATSGAFSDLTFTTRKLEVVNDLVFWVWIWEAKHTGVSPTLGIGPTGKRIHLEGVDVMQWQGDKLVEQWRYNNYLAVLQQLGMIPAAA